MSRVARKPVFEGSSQVRHKPACTATDDFRLNSSDLGRSGILPVHLCSEKNGLISYTTNGDKNAR